MLLEPNASGYLNALPDQSYCLLRICEAKRNCEAYRKRQLLDAAAGLDEVMSISPIYMCGYWMNSAASG